MKPGNTVYINLIERDTSREKARAALAFCILIYVAFFATLAGFYYNALLDYGSAKRLNAQLQSKAQALQKEGTVPVDQKLLPSDLTKKETSVKQVEAKKDSYVDVLGEIENAMPAQMLMTDITFEEKKITLKGYTDEYTGVAELLAGLRKSPVFKNVALASSKLDEKSQEIEFSISMEWKAGRR
mgnify:CR=1 FL=1